MTSPALEDLFATADFIARELPFQLLQGQRFEEFADDEVPMCSGCDKPCDWIYFAAAAKGVGDWPLTWCGVCARKNIRKQRQGWTIHVRSGLHEHLAAVTRLRSQAVAQCRRPDGTVSSAQPGGDHDAEMSCPQPEPATNVAPVNGVVEAEAVTEQAHVQQPEKHPEQLSGARAKFQENMKMILREYFVTGQGLEFKTSGAEIVRQYRKHWKCYNPQWKLLYEVVSSLGFHCSQETVVGMQGKTKQVTRVVCGLKLK